MNKKEIAKLRKAQKNHKEESLRMAAILELVTDNKEDLEFLEWAVNHPSCFEMETNIALHALIAAGED